MSSHLQHKCVLVLNAGWTPVDEITPAKALAMMFTDVATAIDTSYDCFTPTKWDEWVKLPVREGDDAVASAKLGRIRIPRTVVAMNYADVTLKHPRITKQSVRERDGGRDCYTGEIIQPQHGSLEHVIPQSRGGRTTWKNIAYCHRDRNSARGNRPLKKGELKQRPFAPQAYPKACEIVPKCDEHAYFLKPFQRRKRS